MMSFRAERLTSMPLSPAAVWLVADIMEAKGRQELYAKQAPDLLKALREMALVQSVESSNRIEGVTVDPARLRPLVLGNAKPQDRSEEDIRGYREALALIHRHAADLDVSAATIRKLHSLCQSGAADAGQWKRTNNEIVELVPGEAPRVRFTPVAAAATSPAIDELCTFYRHTVSNDRTVPLVAIGAFVLDFLCIHPFRDGNGRVSRLVTLLLLYQHGFDVGRYISLDRFVEEEKARYYEVLKASSTSWHEGRHDLEPWLVFFLGVIRHAGVQFAARAGSIKAPRGAKRALVEQAVEGQVGEFKIGDLERLCPHVSRDMIRVVLRQLRDAGVVARQGHGPGANWRRKVTGDRSKKG